MTRYIILMGLPNYFIYDWSYCLGKLKVEAFYSFVF